MLVKIEEIKDQGLDLTEALKREVLDAALSDSEGFSYVSATPLAVSFRKVSDRVLLNGKIEVTVAAPCKRCLAEVKHTVPVSFSLRMVPEAKPVARDEDDVAPPKGKRRKHHQKKEDDEAATQASSFELDDVDAEPFDGKTIDLDPIVREQVLLALPVSVVCRDDCKGLCPKCGQNLNERDCGHGAEKEIDPRLARLKDLKLKN